MNLCLFLIAMVLGMTDRTVEYSAKVLYQNLETDHHRFLPKQNFVHYELLKVLLKIQGVLSSANTKNNICVGHHCTQTNTNNVWFFFFVQNFFSDNTRIFIFFVANFFFQNLTLGYMTKTLNQIILFFLHQNQNIFFSNIGFLEPEQPLHLYVPFSYHCIFCHVPAFDCWGH